MTSPFNDKEVSQMGAQATPPEVGENQAGSHYDEKQAESNPLAKYVGPEGYAKFLGLSGLPLSVAIGVTAGVGFVLFGYDQGVMGSLLTLRPFLETFPKMNTQTHSTLSGATVGIYEIGCFLGALTALFWGNVVGRRWMIWIGSVFMVIGAIVQTTAHGGNAHAFLWAGRVLSGIGNGQHTSTIPVWQSEVSPPHRRGMLIMIEGSLITFGIMISYWVDFALFWAQHGHLADSSTRSVSWRFPIAFQILLVLPTFITIFLPESPRWLMLRGREEEARVVLSALDRLPPHDPVVNAHVNEIADGLNIAGSVRLRDLFKQGKGHYFHRTALAFVIQMFQQISGINLITYYAGTIFEQSIGLSDIKSRILAACNGTEYFLASLLAIFMIERVGRRPLMIWTALGMSFTMAILCGTLSPEALQVPPEYKNREDYSAYQNNTSPAIAATVFLFVFNSLFAIGWLGMTWLYPAECTPLSIRAQANGISTASNWLFNFMVVMITPIAFANIRNYTYLIFAAINFLMVPASWWIFPETAGRSLEEMDTIFADSSVWNPHDAVRIANEMPRRYDRHGRIMSEFITDDDDMAPVDDGYP
ncbi:hypothetical protein MVES1_002168 [Malassezia vespertilionis]|uniref:uncharacterized protein n=1 Tax=Malassezia vespertilionis TaxID=2020962 RepID=UPI0024B18FFF|nr:uncharacterized protein MVES1_002168 [Malassezia vespertilionis]WFD06814.1 hypothetical protein MVES1_002168 [Malassezia vespertilionis]